MLNKTTGARAKKVRKKGLKNYESTLLQGQLSEVREPYKVGLVKDRMIVNAKMARICSSERKDGHPENRFEGSFWELTALQEVGEKKNNNNPGGSEIAPHPAGGTDRKGYRKKN